MSSGVKSMMRTVVIITSTSFLLSACLFFDPGPSEPTPNAQSTEDPEVDPDAANDSSEDALFDPEPDEHATDSADDEIPTDMPPSDAVDLDTSADAPDAVVLAVCQAEERRCSDGQPQQCGPDGLSWVDLDPCDEGQLCRVGQCELIPEGYGDYCHEAAPCPGDLGCFRGLCLVHEPGESGSECFDDLECLGGTWCNSLGVCTDGTAGVGCAGDDDCGGQTPVCGLDRLCGPGGVGADCIGDVGCAELLLCGPDDLCQIGHERDPCTDATNHCSMVAPICGPEGLCQDGSSGDSCDGPTHCSVDAPICEDDGCSTPGEGTACDDAVDCPITAPFCAPDDQCHNGTATDPCTDDEQCLSTLLCGPAGVCQTGDDGDACDDEGDCGPNAPICFDSSCQDGGPGDSCVIDDDCGDTAPICGPEFVCQPGTSGDPCNDAEDCQADTFICVDTDEEEGPDTCGGGPGDTCAIPEDCGPGAPICSFAELCQSGGEGDPCEGADDCNESANICVAFHCFDGTAGDPCIDGDDCTLPLVCGLHGCHGGLDGDACTADVHCAGALVCGRGTCSDGEQGDPCDNNGDCLLSNYCGPSGFCRNGLDGDDCYNEFECVQDDGLLCTDNVCDGDICGHALLAAYCLIDGECVDTGTIPVEHPCMECQPGLDPTAWTPDATNTCSGLPRAESECDAEGVCVVIDCDDDWDHCDTDHANGCETHLLTDPDHCGTCETECTDDQVCTASGCDLQCPGEVDPCNDACPDYTSDPNNCSECDHVCSFENAEANCVDSACVIGECTGAYEDANEDPIDGCECLPTGAEVCNENDDDCNGVVDDAAAEVVAEDPVNCGVCGNPCETEDHTLVGTCSGGVCGETACPEGYWNNDGHPADGCEYECTYVGAESCNDADEDCDGEIDEDFDLLTDVGNCGECGRICDLTGWNATATCAGGDCAIGSCETGWFDVNGEYDDGCEWEHPGTCTTIWVDAFNFSETQDGSETYGFRTIAQALGVALECDTIQIKPGSYEEPVVLDIDYLTLRGMGDLATHTTVVNSGTAQTIVATGTSITIEHLATSGGETGILLNTCNSCAVRNVDVSDVTGQPGADGTGEIGGVGSGIYVDNSTNVSLTGNVISSIMGGTGGTGASDGFGGTGGIGSGIFLSGSTCTVDHNAISQITAGSGGTGGSYGSGGTGGIGSGIFLSGSTCTIDDNTMNHITGGRGGTGGMAGSGGTGGIGSGICLSASTGNVFTRNQISLLAGGEGGSGESAGANQIGFGFHIEDDSLDNVIERSNTVDDDEVIFVHGQTDVIIEDATLTNTSNTTNFGKVAIFDSTNVIMRNVQLSGYTGESGASGPRQGSGEPGGPGSGIFVSNSTCTIEDSIIGQIVGGTGGTGGMGGSGGTGGIGSGIHLSSSTCTIEGNAISDITGGTGGTGGREGSGGTGGFGSGMHLSGSTGNVFTGNQISSSAGGTGGSSGWSGSTGANQVGFGFYIEDDSLDNAIERSNTVDDDQVIFVHGQTDVIIEDATLTNTSNTTNFGEVVILDSFNILIRNVYVSGHTGESGETGGYHGTGETGGRGSGIFVSNSTCTIEDSIIGQIVGGTGGTGGFYGSGGTGGIANGIHLSSSTCAIDGNTISQITGGTGGTGGREGSGGIGGIANGIHLSSSTCTIEGNAISDITGGTGGTGGREGSGGTGGFGSGMHLSGSTGNVFTGNQISSSAGGTGGSSGYLGSAGANQIGFGFYIEDDSLDNVIERSNTVDDDEVIFVHGQTDVIIEDATLTNTSNTTNFGEVVILDSFNILIRNVYVSGHTGESGETGGYHGTGETGGRGSGIFVSNSTCTIEDSIIGQIVGGTGGTGGDDGSGGTGGIANGIHLSNSRCTIDGSTIGDITGGAGGTGGHSESTGGTVGTAFGIRIEPTSLDNPLFNNSFWSISGGTESAAIYLDTGDVSARAYNSIFSDVTGGPCLFNHPDNLSSRLLFKYNLFYNCEGGTATENTTEQPGTNIVDADPLFVDTSVGNFHLICNETECSPAVDVGDIASECSNEPDPNGCRVNMGAYGNTDEAATMPGAEDCPVCPGE